MLVLDSSDKLQPYWSILSELFNTSTFLLVQKNYISFNYSVFKLHIIQINKSLGNKCKYFQINQFFFYLWFNLFEDLARWDQNNCSHYWCSQTPPLPSFQQSTSTHLIPLELQHQSNNIFNDRKQISFRLNRLLILHCN